MTSSQQFFKHGESSFGIFYPKDYVVIGFSSTSVARSAFSAVKAAGYLDEEVRLFTSEEVLAQRSAIERSESAWSRLKQTFAASVGEEAHFLDQDIEHANKGGIFLVVYSPEDRETYRLQRMMKKFPSAFMRRYLRLGIERLDVAGESSQD